MENRRGFRRGTHMGGQARRSLCRHRLGSGARQICLKIKLISRLGAGPSLSVLLPSFESYCLPAPFRGISHSFSFFIVSRYLEDTSKSKARDRDGGEEGGGPEVLRATDTDPEARREGGAATKSFGLLAAAVAGPQPVYKVKFISVF